MKLSVVVPCYNEQDNIAPLFQAVQTAFVALPAKVDKYELVFVNDGSKDDTRARLLSLHAAHPAHTAVVDFSRNFGKEAAVLAGLRRAGGDLVAIMDADLQQRPEVVVEMVQYLCDHPDTDMVAAYQDNRIEGKMLTFFKKMFYKIVNWMCEIPFRKDASDFRTFRKNVRDAVLSLPEYDRFSKGIFSWVGFPTHYMPYTAAPRHAGSTKWSFFKLLKYAVTGIISYTTTPLRISTFLGLGVSFASVIYLVVTVVQKLCFGVDVPGYATIVGLILLLGGIQLLMLGVMGEYLAKAYMQGKGRPVYIERQYLPTEDDENA